MRLEFHLPVARSDYLVPDSWGFACGVGFDIDMEEEFGLGNIDAIM